jgi:hypothetical protein
MKEDKGTESSDGEDSPINLDDPDSAGFARGRGRTDVTMSFKGTPSFMAPEALLQQGAGLPADIWGVGCTVLEMVTGRAPWVGGGGSHGEGSSGGEFGDSHGSSGTAGGGGSHGSNTVVCKEGQPGKHGRRFSNIFGLVNFMNSSERAAPSVPDSLDIELKGFLDRCFEWDPDHRARVGELLRHAFVDEEEDLYGSSGIESPASGGSKSVFSGETPSSPVHVYVPGAETDQGSGGDPSSSSHGPIPTLPSKRTTNQTIQLARLRCSSATSDSGVHTPGSLIVNAHRMSNFSGYTHDSGLGSSRGSIKTHQSSQSSQSSRSRRSGRDSIRSGCSTNSSHSASGDNNNSNELAAVAETEEEEEDEDEDEDENDMGKWDAGAEDGGGGDVRSGDDEDGEFGDTSSENGSSKHGKDEEEEEGGFSDESSNYTDEATPLVVSPLGANDKPRRGRMPVRTITATEAHRFLALSPKGAKFNVRTTQSGGGYMYTRRRSSSNPTTPSAKNQTPSAKNQTPDSLLKSLLRHNSLKSLDSETEEAEEADEAKDDHAAETDSGQSHDGDAPSPTLSPAEMIQITKRKANEHRRSILPWLHARTGKAVAGRHTRSTLSLLRLLEEEKGEIAGGEAAAADKVTANDAPNPFARGGVFAGAKGVSVANVKVAQQATVNATKESEGQRRTKSTATRGKKRKPTGRSSGSKEAPQEAAKGTGDNSSSSNPFGRGGAFAGARGVVVAARGGEGVGGGGLP